MMLFTRVGHYQEFPYFSTSMIRKQNIRLRLLSYGVIIYMLMAFAWWSILMFTKNRDAFYAKRDLIKIGMIAEGIVKNDTEYLATPTYLDLEQQYRRQENMILGEAIVFVISLVIGVVLINRGYNKEMTAAQQRRNFLLSITHELKSPIASIRLILETFRKRNLNEAQKEKLCWNGLKETERLHTLVNDLLLSAKLETAYQPHREAIDLRDFILDIIGRMEAKYPNAAFKFQTSGQFLPFLGDKLGLTSVVLNLLENAVKYSLEKPLVELKLKGTSEELILEIADQGIGIHDKEKKRIFEKFYRVGNEDTRKTKGTGLGLFIVKQIVLAHNGQISVLDNKPQGTIFRISLPY